MSTDGSAEPTNTSAGAITPHGPPSLRHHGAPPRGLLNTPRRVSYDGRFGRLFQVLADQPAHDPESAEDQRTLRDLSESMRETEDDVSGDNRRIPAGYTYLGQLIDHDITFDPTSLLQRRNDEEGLINFRTPRFDLDSVYGSGPADEPFQYDSGRHSGFAMLLDGFDLPRNSQGVALIGDPRNDENGIVSQLHAAFLALHNVLLDRAIDQAGDATPDAFKVAQRQAQWHYQWVVAHDFLRRLIGDDLHARLLQRVEGDDGTVGEIVRLRHYRHKVNPYLPVEFSVAAYRFGHSQVRDDYSINGSFHRRLFDPSGDDFRGFQRLRGGWHASWPFFFDLDDQPPQLSRLIDTKLSATLSSLQGGAGDEANLALLNLRRGAALGLPSGQAVAREMKADVLDDAELAPSPPGNAPLWFYVLREAQALHGGSRLGPVGGRVVGETLLGLLRSDPQSYLTLQPDWQPTLPTRSGDPLVFDMADLLRAAVPQQATRF